MATFQNQYIFKLIDKISPKLKNIERQVSRTTGKIKRNANKINFSFKGIAGGFKKLGRGILKKTKGMIFSINTLKKSILALAAGVTASSISFASLELGLVNVQNLLSNDDILKYSNALKVMQKESVRSGFSIEKTNKALFDTVSSLGAGKSGQEAFTQAQKLAVAGVTDISTAVQGITAIMNAYGRENTDAAAVANAFFTAQKVGSTTVADLADSVGRAAAFAKVAGVGFEELLSTVSALTLGGIETTQAVTGIRGALKAIVNPGNDARKVLESMNVPIGGANLKANGLSKTLSILAKATKKFGVDALMQAVPEMEGFAAIAALDADKLKVLDGAVVQISKDIKNGTGLNEAYARVNDTMSKKFSQAAGSVKIFAGTIGETFNKQVKSGLDLVTKLSNKTEKFTNQRFITPSDVNSLNNANANQSLPASAIINHRHQAQVGGNITVDIISAEKTRTKMTPMRGSNVTLSGKNTIKRGGY